MNFIDSVKSLFLNYANFRGRTSRSGYWWAQLFIIAPIVLFSALDIGALSTLWSLATIVPALSVLARRLHDSGKSAWLILLGLIPFVGTIILIVFALLPSEARDNRVSPAANEAESARQAETPSGSLGNTTNELTATSTAQTGVYSVEAVSDISGEDRELATCLQRFPESDLLSESSSDYPFFDQWFIVAREKLSEFDDFKDANDPSYAEKEEKTRRKNLLEKKGSAAADYINAASRSLEEKFNSILSDSAQVDDFVSAEDLKWGKRNLPLFSSDFLTSTPQPAALVLRPEPVLNSPRESFFTRLPIMSKLHEKNVAKAKLLFEADHQSWDEEKRTLPERQKASLEAWMDAESRRNERLSTSQEAYNRAVEDWLGGVTEQNAEIDRLFAGASEGDRASVEQYFSIVFSSASYPEEFRPSATFLFEPDARELSVSLSLPDIKSLEKLVTYKYQKGSMSLEPQPPTAAKLKGLYSSLIAQLVVRIGHELAEADRGVILQGISVQAFVKDFDPLANQDIDVLVAQVVSSAEKWRGMNIAGAEAKSMLKVLGGEISANPAEKLKLSPKGSIGRA